MSTITKDEFFAKAQPRQETVYINGLGGDVTIRGLTIKDRSMIQQATMSFGPDGLPIVDHQQSNMLLLVCCCKDPQFTLEDTIQLQETAAPIVEEILQHANRLSGATQSAYDDLKSMMHANPVLRRLYTVAVEKLGRFPSELDNVTEEEFMSYLAATEVQADEDEEEIQRRKDAAQ